MTKFSVIIASVNGLPTIAECLTALENQQGEHAAEIIVVDRTTDETADYIKTHFPNVKLIKSAEKVGIPELRAIGMKQANGDFLIITEDHCIAPKNWFSEFLKAHEKGYAVVGGAIENASRERLTDWATFLCEYSAFMPPIAAGETEFVAGNNVSYERKAIEQVDDDIKTNYWEYFLQAELRRMNVKFLAVPSIVVNHKKEFGFFYFLSQRFHYSRSFAAMRRSKSSVSQQIFYLLYAPVAPFHLTWRIVQNVLRKKRNMRELLLSLPMLFVFMLVYAFGEFVGQIFGAGNSLGKVE